MSECNRMFCKDGTMYDLSGNAIGPCEICSNTRAAAPDDLVEDGWKQAVIDALIVDCICSESHDNNPKKAVRDLISWEVQVALDPQVSEDAQALIDRGKQDALTQQPAPSAELVERLQRKIAGLKAARSRCPCDDQEECTSCSNRLSHIKNYTDCLSALSAGGGVRISRECAKRALTDMGDARFNCSEENWDEVDEQCYQELQQALAQGRGE